MKKKLVVFTLCGMMATSALAGGMTMQTFAAETGDEPMVISYLEGQDDQIPNPWQDYKTLKDAEDILQETLIRYLQTMPELENASHEKAWLLKVAANLSKNRIDYNRVRQTDELEESLVAEKREDLRFVWEAVRALPQKYREVIHLFYHEGYSTAQIAQILEARETTVRTNLRRGRLQLKEILKEEYDFAEV